MRIKRFTAPDMRTALRMVRDEQGPDAVILSNRPCEDGVEVVCATDYDEALVQQALRAVAPTPAPVAAPAPVQVAPAQPKSVPVQAPSFAAVPAPVARTQPQARNPQIQVERTSSAAPRPAAAVPSVRETLASRARAVFRIGDGPREEREPTLAELTAETPDQQTSASHGRQSREGGNDEQKQKPQSRFDEMMAVLNPPEVGSAAQELADDVVELSSARAARPKVAAEPMWEGLQPRPEPAEAGLRTDGVGAEAPPTAVATTAPARSMKLELSLEPAPELDEQRAEADATTPALHAVPRWDADPTVAAMREELAAMRKLIEREMGQFTVERLRGSPARAAAFDLLLGYGCEDNLAQTLAARIDPALDPDKVRAPVLAELARMLRIRRDEPVEDGGVIALIGPTGAGKTTTAAKLAARFAARHRARDVALVTTDYERVGAREQLHAHGRRLGITVCEAHGPEGLPETLEQLRDYPLVIVDTAGYGARDRALLGQITWLRATSNLRSLLVLPANAHPHDMNEVVRRYRMASPEGVVLTKLDETGRLGAALSVLLRSDLPLAYTTDGQQVATDLAAADASHLVLQLEKLRRAADNPLATEDRHVVA